MERQTDSRGFSLAWVWGVFTISDVVQILGISRRKVRLYTEQGILAPSVPSSGRGKASLYNTGDLLKIAVTRHLENFGISPTSLREFLDRFFDPFMAGHSVMHTTAQINPHLLIKPEDFEGGGDPLRILQMYEEWLAGDEFAVFVCRDHEDKPAIDRIRVPTKNIKDGMSGEKLLKILTEHPSAVIVNLSNVVEEVKKRLRVCMGN